MKYFLTYMISILLANFICSCGKDDGLEATLSTNTSVTDKAGNTYTVGFDQVSSINQDPFVEKRNNQGTVVWRHRYEETPVDGKAICITLDRDEKPHVVFTVDGGSNLQSYITRHKVEAQAFNAVFQSGYGTGGGPAVSVIARLNPETGLIEKGTFLTARLTNGNTNTLRIEAIGVQAGGNMMLRGRSAAWPPGKGSTYARFPNITDEDRVDGAFLLQYTLNPSMNEILDAKLNP